MKRIKKHLRTLHHRAINASTKFKKNEDGATAVEFGLVGIPFFFLIFAILEISLIFLAEVNIDQATAETSRLVRTGQNTVNTPQAFITEVCSKIVFVPDCTEQLKVEVKVYDDFNTIDQEDPLDDDGNLRNNLVFNLGLSGSIITVRTYIEWELIGKLPNLGDLIGSPGSLGLGNLPNGNRLVEGFAVFRNE